MVGLLSYFLPMLVLLQSGLCNSDEQSTLQEARAKQRTCSTESGNCQKAPDVGDDVVLMQLGSSIAVPYKVAKAKEESEDILLDEDQEEDTTDTAQPDVRGNNKKVTVEIQSGETSLIQMAGIPTLGAATPMKISGTNEESEVFLLDEDEDDEAFDDGATEPAAVVSVSRPKSTGLKGETALIQLGGVTVSAAVPLRVALASEETDDILLDEDGGSEQDVQSQHFSDEN